jgi:hypothetical protein
VTMPQGIGLAAIKGNSRNESVKPKQNVSYKPQTQGSLVKPSLTETPFLFHINESKISLGSKDHGLHPVSI